MFRQKLILIDLALKVNVLNTEYNIIVRSILARSTC